MLLFLYYYCKPILLCDPGMGSRTPYVILVLVALHRRLSKRRALKTLLSDSVATLKKHEEGIRESDILGLVIE